MSRSRSTIALVAVSALAAVLAPAAASARATASGPTVQVEGAVAHPITYGLPRLASLPRTTVTVTVHTAGGTVKRQDTGVALEELVDLSGPDLPNTENGLLEATVTVRGDSGRLVTFALGELDPSYGHHTVILALYQDGFALARPDLVVPGDRTTFRDVDNVNRIAVGLVDARLTNPPAVGDLDVVVGRHIVVVTRDDLFRLPDKTITFSYMGRTHEETYTELGPTIAAVLFAAHVKIRGTTWVAAVGSDDYVATVTPDEAQVGRRPLLISLNEDGQALNQPSLIVDGDIKGGRDVYDLADLVVGEGSAGEPPAG